MESPKINIAARHQSLDIIRGVIMILMAIDHVRVYSGIPAGSFEPGIFFTRWVTHFCAPGFAFLAGTAAFLYGHKINNNKQLSVFLFSRGLLLVLLEITIIRFFWTFNLAYGEFFLAGVIWMLGWCMVLMAVMVRLKPMAVTFVGLAVIFFQQVFQFVPRIFPASFQTAFGKFWEFIYPSGLQGIEGLTILYVIIPWVGVMAAGYGFGLVVLMNEEKRRKYSLYIGWSAIASFLIAGSIMTYFQPHSNDSPSFLLRLLNQKKYPASQLFLLMTLGPIIASIPYAEKIKGWVSDILSVFGRVPLFYYLLHIPLIHTSALLVNIMQNGKSLSGFYSTAPFTYLPEENRWSLMILYLVFIMNVTLLYFGCKWYNRIKQQHPGILRFF